MSKEFIKKYLNLKDSIKATEKKISELEKTRDKEEDQSDEIKEEIIGYLRSASDKQKMSVSIDGEVFILKAVPKNGKWYLFVEEVEIIK